MNIDVHKLQEIIALIHPYTRWITAGIYLGCFLYINRMFIKDPVLRKWVLASFEETPGKSSGKSLTAFIFVHLVAFATFVAIMYSDKHLLPEYFLYAILGFVASIYGIKLAGKHKMFNGDESVTDSETTETKTESKTTEIKTKKTGDPNAADPDKPEELNKKEDLG